MSQRPPKKSVFVTGASGFIGSAITRAFNRAGYRVYGLVRRPEAADELRAGEIIPVEGAISEDTTFLDAFLSDSSTPPFDVIVSCTEIWPFAPHWEHLQNMLLKIARHAQDRGVRPLVLMSSGCKDYGNTGLHGDPELKPHTEESPLEPPSLIKDRTECTLEVFEHADLFDAAVIRPTPLFGYGGSYYGPLLEMMGRLGTDANRERRIKVPGDGNTIFHGCHIDDCAEAYLALAAHPVHEEVNGQCFNISGYRYETVREIYEAFAAHYKIDGGFDIVPVEEVDEELRHVGGVVGYTQWVDSSKIRKLTGWSDTRMLFSENLRAYILAYEAVAKKGNWGVESIKARVTPNFLKSKQ